MRSIDTNPNCVIVHGCPGSSEARNPERRTYDKHWMPWLKEQLTTRDIDVSTPLMPRPWAPDYRAFKGEFSKYHVSDRTTLIGHSCGCAFLVRWLGETKHRVSKLILVAPWKIHVGDNKAKIDFYDYEIDPTIKDRVPKIIMFTSDNEQRDGKKSLDIFYQALGGKVIELKNHGHYVLSDMGTDRFPELLNEIIEES